MIKCFLTNYEIFIYYANGRREKSLLKGWINPKPLIKLHGKKLFLCAIGSVKIGGTLMKYSFVVR